MSQSDDKARLKQKILGVRIRTARTQRGLDIPQVAQQMGISTETLEQYEEGQAETNLPELEALAQICYVPVTYFWANGQTNEANLEKRITIRRKMLGVQLAQARQKAGLSASQLAEAANTTEAEITSYEYGQKAIPLGQLEAIADHLNQSLDNFLQSPLASTGQASVVPAEVVPANKTDPSVPTAPIPSSTPVAAIPAVQNGSDLEWLAHLPEETKEFLADPANLLYLKLSMRLHSLSADTLRALAEGILDITY